MKNVYRTLLFLLVLFPARSFAQVPLLNSHPSANMCVFLDFDGQLVEGTSWNMWGPLNLGPSNLSTAQISEIYHRVAEDFRPFDINITTDSTKYWAAPALNRMRVIFTVTSDWYGATGGVSYMGSFTWGDNTPAFVFTAQLQYVTKHIAEAASHEAGHTMGLRHQSKYNSSCVKTAEYNGGQGSGEIGWAPIMGVGYYKNMTLWNNGADPFGCSNYQNDLQIITGQNGFSYRTDDYSNALNSSAYIASFANNSFALSGIIERSDDSDVIRFIMPIQGEFELDAIPFNLGSNAIAANLDAEVSLYNGSGNLLQVFNPGGTLGVFIDTFLNPGNYYLSIRGRGNIYAPEYASLGSYNLAGRIIPSGGTVLPVRKFELKGTNKDGQHRLSWIIDADEVVVQQEVQWAGADNQFNDVYSLQNGARSFARSSAVKGITQYRVKAKFSNGQVLYSNTISLKAATGQFNAEVSYLPSSNSLSIKAAESYSYRVLDNSGRVVCRGEGFGNRMISLPSLAAGIYLVELTGIEGKLVQKIMKQ